MLAYVGTYTDGASRGIYIFRVDDSGGDWEPLGVAEGIANPSFLALHPNGRWLYAVSEVAQFQGEAAGGVFAYAVDPDSGRLEKINEQSSGGTIPCHISVDATGRYALVANYGGGSVAILPIRPDGGLEPRSDFVQHTGSGPNPQRQRQPHAHSITPDPNNRFALVADLGIDQVLVYRLDLENGKLLPNDPPAGAAAPGAGPRHLDFHPSGKFVYVINELDSSVTAYTYDASTGTLEPFQRLSTLPADFHGGNTCADVHVSPDGRFLYGSNRGHDSIALFRLNPETGGMTAIGHVSTGGRTPRNFALSPDGRYLYAANQDSDTIVAFARDEESGRLEPTGQVVSVPKPVCIRFLVS